MKVFHLVVRRPLLAALVFDTPRLAGTETGGVHHRVRFEKRPEQIVCDFVALQECGEVFGRGGIGHLHEVDQQVEVFHGEFLRRREAEDFFLANR